MDDPVDRGEIVAQIMEIAQRLDTISLTGLLSFANDLS